MAAVPFETLMLRGIELHHPAGQCLRFLRVGPRWALLFGKCGERSHFVDDLITVRSTQTRCVFEFGRSSSEAVGFVRSDTLYRFVLLLRDWLCRHHVPCSHCDVL